MAYQTTSLTIVYSTVYSDADQRKHKSTATLAFVRGIHRWPMDSPHKGPVTRKMFPNSWRHRENLIQRLVILTSAAIGADGFLSVLLHASICVSVHSALQCRHNELDGVSNHQPLYCFLNRLSRGWSKKTSKLRVTGLCEGNSPVTGEFPAQTASNAQMFPFDDVHSECRYHSNTVRIWDIGLKFDGLMHGIPWGISLSKMTKFGASHGTDFPRWVWTRSEGQCCPSSSLKIPNIFIAQWHKAGRFYMAMQQYRGPDGIMKNDN